RRDARGHPRPEPGQKPHQGCGHLARISGRQRECPRFQSRTVFARVSQMDDLTMQQLVELLPPRIWYLTSNGTDMWCRRPYGFLFSTGPRAEAFATAMGTGGELFAVGLDAGALISDDMLAGLRDSAVTRLFIDPQIDPANGDVHGKILRLAPLT